MRVFRRTIRIQRGASYHGGNAPPRPGLWSSYLGLLDRRPIATAVVTGGVLSALGDFFAQVLEYSSASSGDAHNGGTQSGSQVQHHRAKDDRGAAPQPSWSNFFNVGRFAGAVFDGSVICGGLGGVWYGFLDRFVVHRLGIAESTMRFVFAKLAIEFSVWHPFSLAMFWVIVGLSEGSSMKKIQHELQIDFAPTLLTEYTLWTPIDVLNFKLVPVHLQVLFINLGSLVEVAVLSYIHENSARAVSTVETEGAQGQQPQQDTLETKSRVPRMLQPVQPRLFHDVLAVPLTERQATNEFRRIDEAGKGYITLQEFQQHMRTVPQDDRGAENRPLLRLSGAFDRAANERCSEILFRYLAVTDSQRLYLSDFQRLVRMFASVKFRASFLAEVVFSLFDKDGNGVLDATELPDFVYVMFGGTPDSKQNRDLVGRVLDTFDTNHDGVLSRAEVCAAMRLAANS